METMDCSNERTDTGWSLGRVTGILFLFAGAILLLVYFSRPERVREVVQSASWLKAVLKILLVHGV